MKLRHPQENNSETVWKTMSVGKANKWIRLARFKAYWWVSSRNMTNLKPAATFLVSFLQGKLCTIKFLTISYFTSYW